MVSTRKMKGRNKKQFNPLKDTLNDFVIGNGNTVNTLEHEALESQTTGHHEHFERNIDSASQNLVIVNNFDDGIKNAVDSAVFVVENRMNHAILTAMNNVVFPRIEMAVRSITSSSENGPNSRFENPDRRDFTGNTENSAVRSSPSRLDLNIEQDGTDETRDIDNSEDGDFPAKRFNYDRRAQAHHNCV